MLQISLKTDFRRWNVVFFRRFRAIWWVLESVVVNISQNLSIMCFGSEKSGFLEVFCYIFSKICYLRLGHIVLSWKFSAGKKSNELIWWLNKGREISFCVRCQRWYICWFRMIFQYWYFLPPAGEHFWSVFCVLKVFCTLVRSKIGRGWPPGLFYQLVEKTGGSASSNFATNQSTENL